MIKVEWKWNVPNALSLLRLFLVPVIVVTYWLSDPNEIPYVSIGALVLSGISDSLDGIIARHFNQITDIGKLLETALTVPEIEGIIVNPWRRTLMLYKPLIQIILPESPVVS